MAVSIGWIFMFALLLFTTYQRSVNAHMLGFYEVMGAVHIYHHLQHETISFTFEIPDAVKSAPYRARIDQFLEIFPTLKNNNEPNVRLYRTELAFILETKNDLDLKLIEISEYIGIDSKLEKAQCHVDFKSQVGFKHMQLLATNIEAFRKQITKEITVASLEKQESFTETYGILKNILESLQIYYEAANQYLKSLEQISKGKISADTFDLLKQSDCLKSNPHLDSMQIRECSSLLDKITCILDIETPYEQEKFGKILPIPYFGYEISNFDNTYMSFKTNELVEIKCKHDDYALSNCKIFDDNKNCYAALKSEKMDIIIKDCSFRKAALFTPTKVRSGVLIPQIENITIHFSNEDQGIMENVTMTDLSPPLLVSSNESLIVKDLNFTYIFKFVGDTNKIETTKFSEKDLDLLATHLSIWHWLTYENIMIMVQATIALIAAMLVTVTTVICRRFYKAKKELHRYVPKNPKGKIYSQTLRHFIQETTPLDQ